MAIWYKEIRVESTVNHWCIYGNNGAITCTSWRFLRQEKNIMTCRHASKMNIAEVKIVTETRHLLTEFSVPVLPATKFLLQFAQWFCIIYAPVIQEIYIYFIFFSRFTFVLFIPQIDLYFYVQSWKVHYIGNM